VIGMTFIQTPFATPAALGTEANILICVAWVVPRLWSGHHPTPLLTPVSLKDDSLPQ
jgi:hypothetical protein